MSAAAEASYLCPFHGFVYADPCERCEAERAPDVIGELVGWRAWKLIGNDLTPRVASVTATDFGVSAVDAIWPPDRWFYGVCTKDGHRDVPHEGCSCGLYAAKDLEHLLNYGYASWGRGAAWQEKVIGTVGLAGKVIPGQQGFKAERARVTALVVPSILWKRGLRLGEVYGCDVHVAASLGLQDLWQ